MLHFTTPSPMPHQALRMPKQDPRSSPEYRRLVALAARDDAERQKGIRVTKVVTGDPSQRLAALTFDDGPHGWRTTDLLTILKRLNVKATFFVVGKMALRYPEIIEQMVLDGHELGNHTYNHYRLPMIPLSQVPEELNRTRDVLTGIVGAPTRLFRPPGGEYNDAIQKIIAQEGYTNMLWTDDPADYKPGRSGEKITELVMRDITPGGIILLHSGLIATMNAVPIMVNRMRSQGYQFVTCSELIQRGNGLLHLQNVPARISRTAAT
jgi:peptidoglycan-N-acetylglucosamine deacetylase